jgi:hypothetical protein
MSLSNLTNRLRELSAALAAARLAVPIDHEYIENLSADIEDVEEQIESLNDEEYESRHNKTWQ